MDYAGGGDPARTMALLWDGLPTPRRGPRQRLDLAHVVDTAISVADRLGSGALSMRTLAQALGIGAASLYTYVPGRAELLALMVDRVVGAQPLPSATGGWRAGLRSLAVEDLAGYRAHPWLLQVSATRSVLGPGVVTRYDAALGLLDGLGLDALEVVRCVAGVESYVRGAGAAVVEAEQAPAQTGTSDDDWWQPLAPLLDERLAARFPHMAAMDAGGGFAVSSADLPYTVQRALDRFEHGLELLLDAVGARTVGVPPRFSR